MKTISKFCEIHQINKLPQTVKSGERAGHVMWRCRLCNAQRAKKWRRERTLLKYGLTLKEYDRLLKKQKGKCAICKSSPSYHKSRNFDTDHDHKTGKIRGLLCLRCNRSLPFVEDSKLLKSALKYLERNHSNVF